MRKTEAFQVNGVHKGIHHPNKGIRSYGTFQAEHEHLVCASAKASTGGHSLALPL
jgi:hypothetical protein